MTPARARALVAKAPDDEGLSLRDGVTVWTPPLGMRPPQEGGRSPWGRINDVREIAVGIRSVSTPGHGGLWLSRDRIAQLPHGWETFVGKRVYRNDTARWHEEDCDLTMALWVLVATGRLAEGSDFNLDSLERAARSMAKDYGGYHSRNYERGQKAVRGKEQAA